MSRPPTYEDVNLIVRLYDLRRETKMRESRAWFVSNFRFASLEAFLKACPPGSGMNANARQVITYWDMVASFITNGVLHQDLFFESGRELLLAYVRLKPILEEWRVSAKDPKLFANLETVAKAYIEWMERRSPEAFTAFEARVR